ncbi:MAG: type 3 dihydrofolate reductase [Gammaproteobacteria bacterium]
MIISLISAMSQKHVIGRNGQLPWHLPADLKYFKEKTLGKPIVMGRKTFDSIKKPLPGRHNIVLTRDQRFEAPGCTVVSTVQKALEVAGDVEEVMIVGGETIYRLFLPEATRIYLTIIEQDFEGDTYFPKWEGDWKVISSEKHPPDEKNPYHYQFILLERK